MYRFFIVILMTVGWLQAESSMLRGYTFEAYAPDLAGWGTQINVDEIQGITHSQDHWFITTRDKLYKTLKGNITQVVAQVSLEDIRTQLKGGFYNHFGDLSFHNGNLYIATTGVRFRFSIRRAVPVVVVFDSNLHFVKYGRFPRKTQKGAGWLAINPVNGHLYSSNPYRVVHEYQLNFEHGGELIPVQQYQMHFKYGPMQDRDWKGIPAQGGAFSKSGLFYYVLDHKYQENAPFTGIHAFRLNSQTGVGEAIDLFIPIAFKPNNGKERLWEMEGLTVVSDGHDERLYHLQLLNGTLDQARLAVYSVNPLNNEWVMQTNH